MLSAVKRGSVEPSLQRLYKLSEEIRQTRWHLCIAGCGLLLSCLFLFAPKNFAGLGDEPIFAYHNLRRPLLQFVIVVCALIAIKGEWLSPIMFWKDFRKTETTSNSNNISLMVAKSIRWGLALAALMLFIVLVANVFDEGMCSQKVTVRCFDFCWKYLFVNICCFALSLQV